MHVQNPSDVDKEAKKVKLIHMLEHAVASGECLSFFDVTEHRVIQQVAFSKL